MKRWSVAFGVALLGALIILTEHSTSPAMLNDGDTSWLLRVLKERHDPLSWFFGDWPLANHFYRPICTLVFEFDQWAYGTNAAGYGWTNAILDASCVMLLFWFLRELTNKPLWSAAGAFLFAYWHWSFILPLSAWTWDLMWLTLIVGAIRHRLAIRNYVPAALVLIFLAPELNGMASIHFRMVDWIPGRTASTMTFFALAAMACYARYERNKGHRQDPAPTPSPLTPPATRSTPEAQEQKAGRWNFLWAAASLLFTVCALGCYEQAVMLPACLLAVAVIMRLRGYRPAWAWHVAPWILLGGYLYMRQQILPHTVSRYQKQQLRTTATAVDSLFPFFFPPLEGYRSIAVMADMGWAIIFHPPFYAMILQWVSTLAAYWQARKDWLWILSGAVLSLLAFLPMAWFKMFEHYYYWPMAMRSLFVVALASLAWKLVVIAWSPPELQAPRRSSPAPGSLPHP